MPPIYAEQLHFIQCFFPNQIQFGLEKLNPENALDFPNQLQFGLERKKSILQDADSKPNSDWFGTLLTIVNAQKFPNQIQFGLEKSLTNANALNLEHIPVLFCNVSF